MQIQVIGPLRIVGPGGEIRIPGPRPMAMLSMLALAPQGAVARATLIDRFWGERPDQQAGASLRQTLYGLRQSLGAEGVRINSTGGLVSLDMAGVEVDLLREQGAAPDLRPTACAHLIALSRRELLEGLSLSAPGVEDWLREMREGWRKLVAARLSAASASAFAGRNWDVARDLAEALLALDPFCEDAMTALLRIDGARADRVGARRRFQAFAAALESELGVTPSPELRALMEQMDAVAATGPAERPGLGDPMARILWGGAASCGVAATARAVLIEELSRAGVRVFVAEPAPDSLPVPFLIKGEIVAFGPDQTVLLELQTAGQEILYATRLGFRWPLDLEAFEARMVERARAVGAALQARSMGGTAPGMAIRVASLAGVVTAFDSPADGAFATGGDGFGPPPDPAAPEAGARGPVGPDLATLDGSSLQGALPQEHTARGVGAALSPSFAPEPVFVVRAAEAAFGLDAPPATAAPELRAAFAPSGYALVTLAASWTLRDGTDFTAPTHQPVQMVIADLSPVMPPKPNPVPEIDRAGFDGVWFEADSHDFNAPIAEAAPSARGTMDVARQEPFHGELGFWPAYVFDVLAA